MSQTLEDLLNSSLSAAQFRPEPTGPLAARARIVIVGGGIVGTSIAYHLAKLGANDVLLLEQSVISAGSTWHAAGLIANTRASHFLTEIASYSVRTYGGLAAETGIDIGFDQCGALSISRTADRADELRYLANVGRLHGIDIRELDPSTLANVWPLAVPDGVTAVLHHVLDGTINPGWAAVAFGKSAHAAGVTIREGIGVARLVHDGRRVSGVETTTGELVEAETVVLAAGLWSRDLAAQAGVSLPLYAAEHLHVTTTPLHSLGESVPVLRDMDGYFYARQHRRGLMIGAFEPKGKPRSMESIGHSFAFGEFDEDWEHFDPIRKLAIERIPSLDAAKWARFLCAPESFTPDGNFLLGETAELAGLFTASGFNSQGLIFGAGAGKALAEWIVEGSPTMDIAAVDARRFASAQNNRQYLRKRTVESLGNVFAMHWPHLQPATARGVRRTPLHERIHAARAVFGEANGWERANWYAPADTDRRYRYSYGRQNWFEAVAREHQAARERAVVFDLSSFTKIDVSGPGALDVLQRACTQNVDVPVGRVVYTLLCNERGGIEVDATITRVEEDRFLVLAPGVTQHQTYQWLRRVAGRQAPVGIHDATSAYATLAVMGPASREVLGAITPDDLSDEGFPWGWSRTIEVADARALALRVSFIGELGWELYVPAEYAVNVYDAIVEAGRDVCLANAGYHALDSLRLEKGYRHLGHDIGPADDPFQAGLSFAVSFQKEGDFIGRAALEQLAQSPPVRKQSFLLLRDPEPVLVGGEGIFRDGAPIGRLTSAAYGHTLGGAVAIGYVTAEAFESGAVEVEMLNHGRVEAMLSTRPLYDPRNERLKGALVSAN